MHLANGASSFRSGRSGGVELALLTEGTKIRPRLSMVGCKYGFDCYAKSGRSHDADLVAAGEWQEARLFCCGSLTSFQSMVQNDSIPIAETLHSGCEVTKGFSLVMQLARLGEEMFVDPIKHERCTCRATESFSKLCEGQGLARAIQRALKDRDSSQLDMSR